MSCRASEDPEPHHETLFPSQQIFVELCLFLPGLCCSLLETLPPFESVRPAVGLRSESDYASCLTLALQKQKIRSARFVEWMQASVFFS